MPNSALRYSLTMRMSTEFKWALITAGIVVAVLLVFIVYKLLTTGLNIVNVIN
jgi:hypothetical protein